MTIHINTKNLDLALLALRDTPVTLFCLDREGHILWVENPQPGWNAEALIGRRDSELFGSRNMSLLDAAKAMLHETGHDQTLEVKILSPEDATWRAFKVIIKLMHGEGGEVAGYLCSSIDISEEKRREAQLQALLREVAHRSKNMLAMVLSLSSQTARATIDKDHFMRRFTGRIQSLAKSQDIITDSDWRGGRISDLARRQVSSVMPFANAKITVSGPEVELTPNGALHVGLALHELCTNAISFGALSVAEGTIEINTKVAFANGEKTAVMTWTERPRIERETSRMKCFGRIALERIVPNAVNGRGALQFLDDRIVYSLSIGSSEIVS